MNIKVHASHCCVLHGCKYGDSECPVVLKLVQQLYECETCYNIEQGHSSFSYEDMRKAFNHQKRINDFYIDNRSFEQWIKDEFIAKTS
ncbi:MAG: hypothetical protein AB7V16_07180 [Vulcanibacillus sp.]